jgi:hypothetical protein
MAWPPIARGERDPRVTLGLVSQIAVHVRPQVAFAVAAAVTMDVGQRVIVRVTLPANLSVPLR